MNEWHFSCSSSQMDKTSENLQKFQGWEACVNINWSPWEVWVSCNGAEGSIEEKMLCKPVDELWMVLVDHKSSATPDSWHVMGRISLPKLSKDSHFQNIRGRCLHTFLFAHSIYMKVKNWPQTADFSSTEKPSKLICWLMSSSSNRGSVMLWETCVDKQLWKILGQVTWKCVKETKYISTSCFLTHQSLFSWVKMLQYPFDNIL